MNDEHEQDRIILKQYDNLISQKATRMDLFIVKDLVEKRVTFDDQE